MPDFLVRVSRAFWHSGTVAVRKVKDYEVAEAEALKQVDDIDLKDWGEAVELYPGTCLELAAEAEASESGSAILQQAISEGQLEDRSELRRISLDSTIQSLKDRAEACQDRDPQAASEYIQEVKWLLQLQNAKELVGVQAEDEGLWCPSMWWGGPIPAPEAMLQQALRLLHVAVEGRSQVECALDTLETPTDREEGA